MPGGGPQRPALRPGLARIVAMPAESDCRLKSTDARGKRQYAPDMLGDILRDARGGPGCRKSSLRFEPASTEPTSPISKTIRNRRRFKCFFRICRALDVSPATVIGHLKAQVAQKQKPTRPATRKR